MQGITKILLVKIPHFKDLLVSAFECPHCHYCNKEVQSASAIADRGVETSILVTEKSDLDRQIVKSEYASITFNELDVEIPASGKSSIITTLEGLILKVIDDLKTNQEERKVGL